MHRITKSVFSTLFLVLWSLFCSGQELVHSHSIHHSFIENKGQWNDQVLFKSKFSGGNLWVEQGRFLFHLQDFSDLHASHGHEVKKSFEPDAPQRLVELVFENANEVSEIEKMIPTDAYYNYFIGNDKRKWASNVKGYGEAVLHDLYDGIDLKLIENEFELKYEFHVEPKVDPSVISMKYNGQDKLTVDRKGNLVIRTGLGEIIEQKPYVYQIVNGNIREVESRFILEDNKVTFHLGKYNAGVTLIIDPVLVFATYSGSPSDNFGMTATYGYDGTAYSGGIVFGNSYPTPGPAWNTTTTITNLMPTANNSAGTYGVTDVFISKYSADGTTMLWTCFLGGGNDNEGTETVHSLICDTLNNVYLYGATSSDDFPMQNAYSNTHAGGIAGVNFTSNGVHHYTNGTDIFVSKLSANGLNLLGSTYVGGSDNDGVSYNSNSALADSLTTNYGDPFRGEIMLDLNNNVLIASCTKSTDFPTVNAFQASNAGKQDGVVFKLSNDLSSLIWSSYYGGSDNDACYSVKIDNSDNVVFAGGTVSNDIPGVSGGWQSTFNGGDADGFVVKVPPNGGTITNGSYIGTVNYDQVFFVEIDRVDNIYLVGQSENGSFPVINSPYVDAGSSQFVMRLDETLASVMNSTVWGSGGSTLDISPSAFLVDICGNIYISGWGKQLGNPSIPATNMPITNDAFQSSSTNSDFYLLVIERDFMDTLYATYIGGADAGEHVDGGTSRFDANGIVYQSVCGGCGNNSDFTTTPGAWSSQNLSGNCNNLIFKFDFEIIPKAEFTIDNSVGCVPFTVTFDNNSSASDSYLWDFGNGDTTSVIFEPVVTFDSVGTYQVFLYVTDSICLLTDTAEITITVYDSLELSTTIDQELCEPISIDFTAYTNGSANQFIWSSNVNFTDTLNTDLSDSVYTTTPINPTTYYVQVSNNGCFMIDSVQVDLISSALELTLNDSICVGEITTVSASTTNPAVTFVSYNWSPDSIITTPSSTNSVDVQPNVTQYIYVTASTNNGCSVDDSIMVHVGNIPQALVQATASPYTVPAGGETTLTGEPTGYSYSWIPNFGVDYPDAISTTATVDETTLYTFYVTDGICTRSDTVLVKTYSFVCDENYIYIPNAFSPNGDGENDVLYVRGQMISKMLLRIYDRWGELIFESNDRTIGWDGTFRGKMMDPDVYDYYLQVDCIDGVENIVKGNITLIR